MQVYLVNGVETRKGQWPVSSA